MVDLLVTAIQELQVKFAGTKWIPADILSSEFSEIQHSEIHYVVTCLEAIADVPGQEAVSRRSAKIMLTAISGCLNEYRLS